jgi:hypothetical protein
VKIAWLALIVYVLVLGACAITLMRTLSDDAIDARITIRDHRIEDIQCNPGERIVVFPPTATPSS